MNKLFLCLFLIRNNFIYDYSCLVSKNTYGERELESLSFLDHSHVMFDFFSSIQGMILENLNTLVVYC